MSERERFLQWYMNEFGDHEDARRGRPFAWAAWQSDCPEGWQRVPVEPTSVMEDVLSAWADNPSQSWIEVLAAAPKPEDV